jgi:hypothetical protein
MAETWIDQGGYLSNVELNKKFQMAAQPLMRFRQFCESKSILGKSSGESVNWLKVSNVGTYGGSLVETNTMIETTQTKAWGTLTVNEYGNSIPFTFKVTTLSKFDLERIVRQGLLDDCAKVLDAMVEREFNKTAIRLVATSTTGYVVTTNSAATATNTGGLTYQQIRNMMYELKKLNVPGYNSLKGDYVFIGSLEAMNTLYASVETVYQQSDPGHEKLVNGEVTRYFGVRLVEDGWASRYVYSPTARSATATAWSAAASAGGGPGYMFGSPTVFEAIVVPEEVRAKEVTDFGRSHGLAWYALQGWSIVWTGAANARIIKFDSVS